MSIIRGGLIAFDHLIVAVLNNPQKTSLFSMEERLQMVRESCDEAGFGDRVSIDSFEGLLVDYAQQRGVNVLLRGLRAVKDYEYELQMASMNRHLDPQIETVFIMANETYFYVASNLVKEVRKLGGDVSELVPEPVARRLSTKLG